MALHPSALSVWVMSLAVHWAAQVRHACAAQAAAYTGQVVHAARGDKWPGAVTAS
jgi:hypothetical protein